MRQVELPPDARAFRTLAHVDYEDAFHADIGPGRVRTGEQWARTVLEGPPSAVRRILAAGWLALGLRLGDRPADACVSGWKIRRSATEFVLLGADSRLGLPAELLFAPREDTLLFATFVRRENPGARGMWAAVAPVHRRIVTGLLERGTP